MFVRASGLALRTAIENPSDFPRGLDRLWVHAETIPAAQALHFFRDTARRGSVVILCGMDGVEIAAVLTYIDAPEGHFLVDTLSHGLIGRAIRIAEGQMVEPSFEERILSQDRTGLITSIRRDEYLGEYVLQYYADSNFYSPDVRWTKTKDPFTFDEISADDAVQLLVDSESQAQSKKAQQQPRTESARVTIAELGVNPETGNMIRVEEVNRFGNKTNIYVSDQISSFEIQSEESWEDLTLDEITSRLHRRRIRWEERQRRSTEFHEERRAIYEARLARQDPDESLLDWLVRLRDQGSED